jgi:hypothetical protein
MGGGNSKRKTIVSEADSPASQSSGIPASPVANNADKIRGSPAPGSEGTPTKAAQSRPTPPVNKGTKPLPTQPSGLDTSGKAQGAADSASAITAFYEVCSTIHLCAADIMQGPQNAHTHTQTHDYTQAFKASPSDGWTQMKSGDTVSIFKNTSGKLAFPTTCVRCEFQCMATAADAQKHFLDISERSERDYFFKEGKVIGGNDSKRVRAFLYTQCMSHVTATIYTASLNEQPSS